MSERENSSSSVFENNIIQVEVSWDIRDNYIDVIFVPRVSSKSKEIIRKDEIYLEYLLRVVAPDVKLKHKVDGDILEELPTELTLMHFSDTLKKYGKELLQGDMFIWKKALEKQRQIVGKILEARKQIPPQK